jgi:uncharacterized membrane protein
MNVSPTVLTRGAPERVVALTHRVALASLIGLIALGLAWELWLAPTGSGTLALKVLPLLLSLHGIWRSRLYAYRVLSLTVWLYFTEGVVRAYGDAGLSAVLAGIQIVLCLILFVACLLQVRSRTRAPFAAEAVA